MSRINSFLLFELVVVLGSAIAVFKNFKTFLQCFYSSTITSWFGWSKKLWNENVGKSMKFEFFLLIVGLLTGINILIFRYIVK